tara:strand:- start:1660 stop:1977 length:318 start_codon:yes stop_codon:yes gene_type:complete
MGNAKRRKGQQHTPELRASIRRFLETIEFATMKEIALHVREDDLLPLSGNERERVGRSVMREPTFLSFETVNSVGKLGQRRPQKLWRNNPNYVDWRIAHAQRKKD